MRKLSKILVLAVLTAILNTICVFADTEDGYVYTVYDAEAVITDYTGTEKYLIIPGNLGGYPVTAIGREAFKNKNLEHVGMPDSVTLIGEGAFADNPDLMALFLSCNLKDIPARMCENDASLYDFIVYGNVKSIGDEAFKNCVSLSEINFANTEEKWNSIYFGADWDKNMPDGYTVSTGEVLDFGYGTESVKVSEYQHPELCGYDVVIPSQVDGVPVTQILSGVFRNKDITSVVIPDSVTSIYSYAFAENPDLISVELPANLEIISNYLFSDDTGLEEVFIPASVTQINAGAFANCSSLEDIYFGGTQEAWNGINKKTTWNDGVPDTCTVHFESAHLPRNTVSEPASNQAESANLRKHAALRFTADSDDYNSFDKLGFLVSRKDTMQRYGFNLLTHDTAVYGTPLYKEALCVDETHNRIYDEDDSGKRTYSVIISIPDDKTDTVFVARPFLEIGASTLYGTQMEGSYDDLSI